MEFNKDLQDELNELSPTLAKLDKSEGFQVPPRYFEKLTQEVLQKSKADSISSTKHQTPQWQQNLMNIWATIWQPRVAIGLATIIMLVLATTFFFNNQSELTTIADIGSISDEELDLYIQENFDGFDESLFASVDDMIEEGILPSTVDDQMLDEFYEHVIEDVDINDLEDFL